MLIVTSAGACAELKHGVQEHNGPRPQCAFSHALMTALIVMSLGAAWSLGMGSWSTKALGHSAFPQALVAALIVMSSSAAQRLGMGSRSAEALGHCAPFWQALMAAQIVHGVQEQKLDLFSASPFKDGPDQCIPAQKKCCNDMTTGANRRA